MTQKTSPRSLIRRSFLLILSLVLVLSASACSTDKTVIDSAAIAKKIGSEDLYGYRVASAPTNTYAVVMKSGGAILIEMDAKSAPITVAHIKSLVGKGFYDGLLFHRVVHDFVIQTGSPNGDGTGGSDKAIKGEFSKNGVNNPIKHAKYVVSMGRLSGDDKAAYNSADSQFFICLADESATLDGSYAAFGKVVAGFAVVDRVGKVDTAGKDGKPIVEQPILSAFFVEK